MFWIQLHKKGTLNDRHNYLQKKKKNYNDGFIIFFFINYLFIYLFLRKNALNFIYLRFCLTYRRNNGSEYSLDYQFPHNGK